MSHRVGLIHISSMMAVASPKRPERPDHSQAPWQCHWMKTCAHDTVARIKRYDSGLLRAKLQCRKCGQGIGQNVPMAGVTEPWDEAMEARVLAEYESAVAEYRRQWDELTSHNAGRKCDSWWRSYNVYLRTAVWQAKRQLVLDRAGGVCEACGQKEAQQVHHLKYPETFGLEPLWDLRAVCIPCHKIIHPHMD